MKLSILHSYQLFPFLLLFTLFSLSSCYYSPDLRGQTIGSAIGGVGTGLLIVGTHGGLIEIGAGAIGGSLLGSVIGQEFDNYSALMMEDPVNTPVKLYYYETIRPPFIAERYRPAKIILPTQKTASVGYKK